MAERRTRRSFTREFKAQAVKRLLDGGKGLSEVAGQSGEIALMAEPVWQFRLSDGNEPLFSVPVRTQGCQTFPNAHPWASHPIALSEVATELDIGTGQLSQWRTEHLAAGSAEALAVRQAEQAETQRLKRAVKRLEEEGEILRKAAAFFARGIA